MAPDKPTRHAELTDEEIEELKVMLREFEHYRWLGRLAWRIAVVIGGMVAAIAAFKEHLVSFFKGH